MARVVVSEAALADLDAAAGYLSEYATLEAAQGLLDEADTLLQDIADFPEAAQILHGDVRRRSYGGRAADSAHGPESRWPHPERSK